MIEAVLFDWGGTLSRFANVDMLDLWRAAAQVLAPDRVDELAAALLAAEDEVWARTGSSLRSATTHDVLAAASAAVGLDVEAAAHDVAVEAYLDGWAPHTVAREDAKHVLAELRGRGLRTGMLSNTHWPREWHERWLSRDGILDLLEVRVYTSDLEHIKPHPATFRVLLDALDVAPERAVFVGDRLLDDISGGKAVGMRTVHIDNAHVPRHDVEPDAHIVELTELLDVVSAWS